MQLQSNLKVIIKFLKYGLLNKNPHEFAGGEVRCDTV